MAPADWFLCAPDQATLFGMEDMEALLVLCTYLARLLLALSEWRSLLPWVPEVRLCTCSPVPARTTFLGRMLPPS